MKVAIIGELMVILLPLNDPIGKSASGKTLVVASSHGNRRTSLKIDNNPVIVNANAYIRPKTQTKSRSRKRRGRVTRRKKS